MAEAQSDLPARVKTFVQRHHLVASGDTLVVAVSGGPDSVCLLHVLWQLRDELNVHLHVAHLNHQLRGAESRADVRYVTGLAKRLGIPATIEARDVAGYRTRHRLGLEEAARQVRYEFLARVADSTGSRCVAVGHTADDQAETILMHLVRGAGGSGLRGMLPRTPWLGQAGPISIVRPLLEVRRQEVAAYCRAHGLEPRLDASNLELSPLRNRIRHRLVPLLEKLNPAAVAALLRMARAVGDDLDFIESQVAQEWGQTVQHVAGGLALDKARLSRLHPALRRHLLRRALEEATGERRDVEAVHIEQAMALLERPAGSHLDLLKGLTLYADYRRLLLGADPARLCPLPPLSGEHHLRVPGTTEFPGWRVAVQLMPAASSPPPVSGGWAAELDFAATGAELMVRGRLPGDRFQPLGMDTPKKLQDFFVDEKVPRPWRARVPLVASSRGIVWAVGYRIASWARVTVATRQVLRLDFELLAS